MAVRVGTQRSFLFLQGLATPFFVRLAGALERRGYSVERINFSGGDRLFWPKLGAVDYRGRFDDWRAFLGGFLHERGVTDIVLFGDCRPYHQVAADLARSRGIEVHVFEEGYFRPHWITLERGGTNGYSRLPRDIGGYLAEAAGLPPEEAPALVSGGFSRRVRWELLNQIATLLFTPFYPHYRRHRSQHPFKECGGWLMRLAKLPYERRYTARLSRYLKEAAPRYFLLPLQLETDYQIRRHSPFRSMAEVVEVVLRSFAKNAPAEAVLVIKLHPLDNGLVNFRKAAKRIAAQLGLAERVVVIDGGHLPTLLAGSDGVVVVNSTTALSALYHNRPVKALGKALFDFEGLTFQAPLDRFWRDRTPPDQALFRAFRQVVLARAQINGSFFTQAGLGLAVEGAIARMGAAPVAQSAAAASRREAVAEIAAAKSPLFIRD
jgi:capsular polysaccharide export protein